MFRSSSASSQKLPGLNALRAIAASVVLIGHVYQISALMGLGPEDADAYRRLAHEMVNLFFVISGFIITYILLQEKGRTGTISLKSFYIKRTLRIWPIYFLIFGAVVLIQTFTNAYAFKEPLTVESFFVFLFFLVSLNNIFFTVGLSVLPHYWSLSVEELFYLYWPFVVKHTHVIKFSLPLIVAWVLMRNSFAYLSGTESGTIFLRLNKLAQMMRFPSMGIGAIGAYATVYKKNWFARFTGKPAKIIVWMLFVLATLTPELYVPYIHYEVLAFLYLLLILNVINNSERNLTESKFMNETGKISYGIYMYHWPIIPLLIVFLKHVGLFHYFIAFYHIPLILLTYGIVWAVSYLSFYYFESYFLKMKKHV